MSAKALLSAAVSVAPVYVEDVFSTFLYTGTGATQTITNGIDLSGKGGLTWSKDRSAARTNSLIDTVRGATFEITSDDAGQQTTESNGLNQFNSNGYRIGPANNVNASGENFVSWTFREQAKFFDVLTYTGTGVNRTIAHNLGSVPGCIMVKRTTTYGYNWAVYHRSLANTQYLVLNSTAAAATGATWWNSTTPTSAVFSVGTDASVNDSGATYVAYLFAHDAGGFGTAGTDNVVSCGSYTGNGSTSGPTVTLGWEPQWLLVKRASGGTGDWALVDTMRGFGVSTNVSLEPNSASAESTATDFVGVRATGFQLLTTDTEYNGSGNTYIYIAIRRGPMKTPTVGTSVFEPLTYSGTGTFPSGTDPNSGTATRTISSSLGFDVDMSMTYWSSGGSTPTPSASLMDKLRGIYSELRTYDTSADSQDSNTGPRFSTRFSRGFALHDYGVEQLNNLGQQLVTYVFRRAPGFFDVVCYTGTGVATTFSHNLMVVPEFLIVKRRNAANNWAVYAAPLGNTNRVFINQTQASAADSTLWNDTTPTNSVFTVGTAFATNNPGDTYVAYLFATCAGVSKVGSYTGTGTTLQINCGFTAGARFVLIKRTDSTGDWYVWDTARGIISGNDSYLLLNSTAAEVTGTDYIDPLSSGFEISSTAPAAINANGGSYIFLAIS